MNADPIRIATRASQLALWQANYVAELLRLVTTDREVTLVHVSTTGDRDQTESLQSFGGLGVFTREVQKAILDGRADLAVHSLKDLPTEPVEGLVLAAVPQRASMFDALVLPQGGSIPDVAEDSISVLDGLPEGATVGTGSLRRQAQLLHQRGDLQTVEVRGNVETRLRKLDAGKFDALILAVAGLNRLSLSNRISTHLRPPLMFPAVGQGALGIECRVDDGETCSLLNVLSHSSTYASVTAERSLLAALRAGCHAPVGVFTTNVGERLTLEAVVLSPNGQQRLVASHAGSSEEAESLGRQVADDLMQQGARELIEAGNAE